MVPWCIVDVFALCNHLISKNNKNNMTKGCLIVMADPFDFGHSKKDKGVHM